MEPVNGYPMPPEKVEPPFPTGKRELRFLLAAGILGVLLADFALFGGLYLGFALVSGGSILAAAIYLFRCGCKPNGYTGTLLVLSLVICGSFIRSNDGFVKFVMICFLLVSGNLGLCLLAGQNRRDPKGVATLLDVPRTAFVMGIGRLGAAARGVSEARKSMGTTGKNRSAVLVGLLIAIPVLAVMIPLLISADAAFEGLLQLLPEVDLAEPFAAVFFGVCIGAVLYTRTVALAKGEKAPEDTRQPKIWNHLTVNTALCMVCLLYGVYLLSQLAYLSGSFLGILPEEFTMAEYARRGFFEMVLLCAINLGLMTMAVGLTGGRQSKRSTRILCLMLGAVTLFLIVTAGTKMMMYIGSYGLTRLRLLTSVIMVFFAVMAIVVCIWLLVPRIPYMKVIILAGLILGAATAWADVDTLVAAYNVRAYQAGELKQVDVAHLCSLSDGAVVYIEELALDEDPVMAFRAKGYLQRSDPEKKDWRSWSIAESQAYRILEKWAKE